MGSILQMTPLMKAGLSLSLDLKPVDILLIKAQGGWFKWHVSASQIRAHSYARKEKKHLTNQMHLSNSFSY